MGIDLQAADVIVPVITAVLTLVGVIVTNNSRDRVNEARSEEDRRSIHAAIDRLERKQDKHNQLIERMYAAEKDISVLDSRVCTLEHKELGIGDAEIEVETKTKK